MRRLPRIFHDIAGGTAWCKKNPAAVYFKCFKCGKMARLWSVVPSDDGLGIGAAGRVTMNATVTRQNDASTVQNDCISSEITKRHTRPQGERAG